MQATKTIKYVPPRGAMAQAFPTLADQLLMPSDPPAVAWAKMGDDEGLARYMQRAREAKNLEQAIEACDEQKRTALVWSCQGFSYLRQGVKGIKKCSLEWVLNGRDRCAQLLVDAGADVEAGCRIAGFRPIEWAVLEDRHQALRLLLSAGANPHAQSPVGVMPIHTAYQLGHVKCLSEFIRSKAFNAMDPEQIWDMLKSERDPAISADGQAQQAAWLLDQLGLGTQSWVWKSLVEFRITQPAWAGRVMSTLEALELTGLTPTVAVEKVVRRI